MKRLNNFRQPIREAYFPKLDSLVASRAWPARQTNCVLHDLNRQDERLILNIGEMERWRDRIYDAIHLGFVVNSRGERVPLTERNGIDVLGNVVESSILSPNPNLYGSIHNMGHVIISLVHDPDHRYLVSRTVFLFISIIGVRNFFYDGKRF